MDVELSILSGEKRKLALIPGNDFESEVLGLFKDNHNYKLQTKLHTSSYVHDVNKLDFLITKHEIINEQKIWDDELSEALAMIEKLRHGLKKAEKDLLTESWDFLQSIKPYFQNHQ